MSYEKASEAAAYIGSKYKEPFRMAVVLGSGLGAFAEELKDAVRIPYTEIPHFARTTVEGHEGRLVLGTIGGVPIAVLQGRFHFYEGYAMAEVIFPIRTLGLLGVENLILTNAAGSLNTDMPPGSLMLINDHLNLMGTNPLRGKNDERFGARFPDMSEVYDRGFQSIVVEEAAYVTEHNKRQGDDDVEAPTLLHRGAYCALSGPTYETPAEIHMYRLLGADAVGMSTVPEAIAARHQGMKVIGISCITNFAAGMTSEAIDHEDVLETGTHVAGIFTELLKRVIGRIA